MDANPEAKLPIPRRIPRPPNQIHWLDTNPGAKLPIPRRTPGNPDRQELALSHRCARTLDCHNVSDTPHSKTVPIHPHAQLVFSAHLKDWPNAVQLSTSGTGPRPAHAGVVG